MAIFNKDRNRRHRIYRSYSSIVNRFKFDGGGGVVQVLEKPLALSVYSLTGT